MVLSQRAHHARMATGVKEKLEITWDYATICGTVFCKMGVEVMVMSLQQLRNQLSERTRGVEIVEQVGENNPSNVMIGQALAEKFLLSIGIR